MGRSYLGGGRAGIESPVWANEMHEYPYLQWSMEVHRAKLKASYPHAADKIQMGGPQSADEVYARASRVAISQGLPTTHPGDALFNLITFRERGFVRGRFTRSKISRFATRCSRFFPTAATRRLPEIRTANRATKPWTIAGA